MRNFAVLATIIVGLTLSAYILFIKEDEPLPEKSPIQTSKKSQNAAKNPIAPEHHPSKTHSEHYTGPTYEYADEYFKNEQLREELQQDREELADYIRDYDRYNHYDFHDEYENAYNDYRNDDYYYDDYYDYMYPQFDPWEWEQLYNVYSDPDVKEYLKDENEARKLEKEDRKPKESEINRISPDRLKELNKLVENRIGPNAKDSQKKNVFSRVNEATKDVPTEKLKKINAKLSNPVVQKESKLKKQFLEQKKEEIAKIGPNTGRTLDLFQAKKGEKKFYIFGTHEKEAFKEALPDTLYKKVIENDVLITDNSSREVSEHFASQGKVQIEFQQHTLDSDVAHRKEKRSVVVVKAALLFGDEGLLKHLIDTGYTIMRYSPDLELRKFELPQSQN